MRSCFTTRRSFWWSEFHANLCVEAPTDFHPAVTSGSPNWLLLPELTPPTDKRFIHEDTLLHTSRLYWSLQPWQARTMSNHSTAEHNLHVLDMGRGHGHGRWRLPLITRQRLMYSLRFLPSLFSWAFKIGAHLFFCPFCHLLYVSRFLHQRVSRSSKAWQVSYRMYNLYNSRSTASESKRSASVIHNFLIMGMYIAWTKLHDWKA